MLLHSGDKAQDRRVDLLFWTGYSETHSDCKRTFSSVFLYANTLWLYNGISVEKNAGIEPLP